MSASCCLRMRYLFGGGVCEHFSSACGVLSVPGFNRMRPFPVNTVDFTNHRENMVIENTDRH